jgi:hypothetical protein
MQGGLVVETVEEGVYHMEEVRWMWKLDIEAVP